MGIKILQTINHSNGEGKIHEVEVTENGVALPPAWEYECELCEESLSGLASIEEAEQAGDDHDCEPESYDDADDGFVPDE